MVQSWAIVLAGGQGERVAADVNKVYLEIARRRLLHYSLDTLSRSENVHGLVVVVRLDDVANAKSLAGTSGIPVRIVAGGASRHASESLGLRALAPEILEGGVALVGIHDGARPFADLDLVDRLYETARERGGAVPGLPVDPPLFRRAGDSVVPLNTTSLARMQTPQVFDAGALLEAYRRADDDGFEGVDTAETVERYSSLTVGVVPGDSRNFKITFPEDLQRAERLAAVFREGRWVG